MVFKICKEALVCSVIIIYIFAFYFSHIFWWFTIKGVLHTNQIIKTATIVYLIYMLVSLFKYHSICDGNGSLALRSRYFLGIVRDYFPVQLRKTAELPPNRNYILAHFPHGILTAALVVNLVAETSHWLHLFPGIRPKVATLNINFTTPFWRELLRVLGYISSSKPALLHYLNKSNDPTHPDNRDGFTSYLLGISVGGAQEAILAQPGEYTIVLKKRKGFVKLAIETGSSIVPSFGFGDVDVYTPLNKAWFRPMQMFVKKLFGYNPILFKGRGNSILPYKKRIVLVVGSPIDVRQSSNPDAAYIEEIHAKVTENVLKLFNTYKSEYIQNSENVHLTIT